MRLPGAAIALLLAGCASLDGSSLVPEKSTTSDVQALMGEPAQRLTIANGDTVLYYPHGPAGMQTFAVHLSPDGVVKSVDQLLKYENLKKLVPNTSTTAQVREDFGPPGIVTRFDRLERDVWQYRMFGASQDPYYLYVQFSFDGVVREVLLIKDYNKEPGGTGSKG